MKPDAIKPIIACIAALLDSGRIDEAEALLSDPRLRGESVSNVEVIRLEQRLAGMKREAGTDHEIDDALERALADVIDSDDDR